MRCSFLALSTKASEAARRLISNWHYNYGHPKTVFSKKSEQLVEDVDSVAELVRLLKDETPADPEWLRKAYPATDRGWTRFGHYPDGRIVFFQCDVGSISLGVNVTRGLVRAFALGMRLQLQENEE